MKLNPPIIYGAFGDKRALFYETLESYQQRPCCFAERALTEESDPRQSIERLLMDAARVFTRGAHPRGCMMVLSALNCSDEAEDIKERLTQIRQTSAAAIVDKLKLARRNGQLPAHLLPDVLGNLIVTVFQGLSIRARDGATRAELEAVVRQVLALWPVAEER